MLENMIAVQKELVLERKYYMDDKMAYFMNKLIDEDEIIKAVESCVQNQKDELIEILDAGGVSWLSV